MEAKSVVMSALGIGIGVGVGLGLASAPWAGGAASGSAARAGVTVERVEQELRRLMVDGAAADSKVTFDEFPYYLSEQTRVVLTSAAYVHLKQADISKYTRNLAPASRAILLTGPAVKTKFLLEELYQQMLAKALAHYFQAKLLLLDPTDFLIKPFKRSISETTLERVSGLLGSLSILPQKEQPKVFVAGTIRRQSSMTDVKLRSSESMSNLPKLRRNASTSSDMSSLASQVSYHLMNNKEPEYRNGKLVLSAKSLSHALEIFQETKMSDKDSMKLEATGDALKAAEKGTATAAAKSETKPASLLPPVRPAAAAAPAAAAPAPAVASKAEPTKKDNPAPAAKAPDVPPDNEFEKRIRPEVIPANEIGVSFEDIGALDDIKESLHELVMLPLRRPDLFKGGLLKPCRGILLFGPPGTGKTMLAKAIANEAQASFINVSMSTITSKWFGEDEKNVRALFTLAAKVSPTIIFVDEVDSMLGQRNRAGEHEAMRKIKNEFMTHWDGLLSRPDQRILVLAATNRPFDLDEAIIRRFERRIMVGLPSTESRELIMRRLLSKEKVDEGLDFKELATMTEGYSGSDLKNLCTTAAYRPVRELIQKERKKELEKLKREKGGIPSDATKKNEKEEPIILRPLNMADLKEAKNQVAASFAAEGAIMGELRQWNELYGEGGSRKKQQLTYFL
nr:unnamed protein product [Digitaria exilis]